MERAAALASAVRERGGPALATVEWRDEVVSTSDRLKALARGGAPEWTVVLADRQTGGRGREGRSWTSPPGGLYMSVLLRPRFEKVSLLPLAAGVAVAEAAGALGVATELKWPNDVVCRGRKLAGVLSEAASGPTGVEWVVLGIGVNVALEDAAIPADLRGVVTSLAAEGASGASLPAVAADVLAAVWRGCALLASDPAALLARWRERAAPWWGETVEATTAAGRVRGVLRDIDADGALLLEPEGGGETRLLSGEVSRVRRAGLG
jgi:BirA family biotin operon repressor/biotin-[acetyl-CoA-carboxylase] ligase